MAVLPNSICHGFNQISLDDTHIFSITRTGDCKSLTVELDVAYLLAEHPLSDGEVLLLERCQLSFSQIAAEKIRYWNTSQLWSEWQPDVKKTLQQIMTSEYDLSYFTLRGFTDDGNWFEWCIETDHFMLRCGTDHSGLFSINGEKNGKL
ncbi:hypothetical protein [Pectobacterium sp. B1J-3]|uniref:hypothetical protein n=1 Tax=Pectobacterium sp. B1J-3 TaxID=3385371 RepID=UPI0039064E59